MKLLVTCLFAILTTLHAQTLILSDNFQYTKASSAMEYVADTNHSLSIEKIDEADWKPMISSNLGGFNNYPSWTKCSLKNDTDKDQKFIIKNPRAGMDEIDIYIIRNKKINHTTLGAMYPIEQRSIPHRYSAELIELAPQEEVKIISRLANYIGSTEGEWEVFDRKYFLEFTMLESLWWGIFIGVYLALFFYATPILIASKDKLLALFFSLYTASSIGYQLAINGIFYSLGLHGEIINIVTLFFGILFLTFTILVVLRFLKMTHHQGNLSKILRLVLVLLACEILIAMICIFLPQLLRSFSIMILFTAILVVFIWLLMLKDLLQKSHDKIFRYIFIGYTAIFIAYAYQMSISLGIFPLNAFSIYSVSLGGMIEMYFFALGISAYIKQIQYEKIKNEQLLDFQMRFASIGRVIGNISHQWKMPMVRAGSLLTHIEALIHFKNTKTLSEIEQIIPQIRSHFIFMQNTIDEFYSLYRKNTNKAEFKLLNVINDVWGMLSTKVSACDMKLHIRDLQDTQLYSFEYSFSHIVIILIDNALDAMKNRAISNPHMMIDISHENGMIQIIFEDNCGGIEQNPIESIFDTEISSKHSSKITGGLGLSIVKLLVNEKFGGTITASNTEVGAKFVLHIPMNDRQH